MFAVGGESKIEIFESGYNTIAVARLQNLGKFINYSRNYVNFPEFTNNIPSFVLQNKWLF